MEPVYLAAWIVGGVVQDVTAYLSGEARQVDIDIFRACFSHREPGYADVLTLRVASADDYSWGVETNGDN